MQGISSDVASFFLVWMRLVALFIVAPFFSESVIPPRHKGFLSIVIALTLTPFLSPFLTIVDQPLLLLKQGIFELCIGFFMGLMVRVVFATLDLLGFFLSAHLGLSNVFFLNSSFSTSSGITSTFIYWSGLIFVLSFDIHHDLLRMYIQSYSWVPSYDTLLGDCSDRLSQLMSAIFDLAFRLSGPFFVVGTVFFLIVGFLNRIITSFQFFFLITSVHILLSFLVLYGCLVAILELFYAQICTLLYQ